MPEGRGESSDLKPSLAGHSLGGKSHRRVLEGRSLRPGTSVGLRRARVSRPHTGRARRQEARKPTKEYLGH